MSGPRTDLRPFVSHRRLLTAARMVHAVRPENWDDGDDADAVAAWSALEEALRPLGCEGDAAAPGMDGWDLSPGGWSASAEGWGVVAVWAAGLIVGLMVGAGLL